MTLMRRVRLSEPLAQNGQNSTPRRAYFFDPNPGVFYLLPTVENAESKGIAINDDGVVLCDCIDGTKVPPYQTTVWNRTNPTTLTFGPFGLATDINETHLLVHDVFSTTDLLYSLTEGFPLIKAFSLSDGGLAANDKNLNSLSQFGFGAKERTYLLKLYTPGSVPGEGTTVNLYSSSKLVKAWGINDGDRDIGFNPDLGFSSSYDGYLYLGRRNASYRLYDLLKAGWDRDQLYPGGTLLGEYQKHHYQ